jgi:hypothetical protein
VPEELRPLRHLVSETRIENRPLTQPQATAYKFAKPGEARSYARIALFVTFAAFGYSFGVGCSRQPLVAPATPRQRANLKKPAPRVVACQDSACQESERADAAYAYYAVDSMTRKMARLPEPCKGVKS